MNKVICEDLAFIHSSPIISWDKLYGKTVLVTGAYGMLASYMVFMLIYLNEKHPGANIKILAVGRSEEKFRARFGDYMDRPYFHALLEDVCTMKVTEHIDYVIHAASPASTHVFGTNPVGVMLPNLIGTTNMLECAQSNKVEGFLYFSSCAVYGDLEKDSILETDVGRVDPMDIRNCYAESKRAGECLVHSYAYEYGLPACIVRLPHTYGPTTDIHGDSRVFAEFVSDVVYGRDITVKGDGTAVRTFCYIADATVAYFKLLLDCHDGKAYNVSNEKGAISILELARLLSGLYPEKQIHVSVQAGTHQKGYIEAQRKNQLNYSTAKLGKLGWQCSFSLEDGFKRTIQSFLTGDDIVL